MEVAAFMVLIEPFISTGFLLCLTTFRVGPLSDSQGASAVIRKRDTSFSVFSSAGNRAWRTAWPGFLT